MKGIAKGFVLFVLFMVVAALPGPALGADDWEVGDTERVSVQSGGGESFAASFSAAISADGRYVAFISDADNLVTGDSNSSSDIFVHDRTNHTTELVSVASDGTQANGAVVDPSISADGRYVTFCSEADSLVAGDSNGAIDVFVHDRQNHTTIRVSVASNGDQSNADSGAPNISGNGNFVVFASSADNLVTGDSNGYPDVFIHDLQTHVTELVSVAPGGVQGDNASYHSSVSADGRFVAFDTDAENLAAGDTNLYPDIIIHDRQTGTNTLASVASSGTQGLGYSSNPAISNNGNLVAFESDAANLAPDDACTGTSIFLRNVITNTTSCVSVDSSGNSANGDSTGAAISGDGNFVAFSSEGNNLVAGDNNGLADVFLHDAETGVTRVVSVSSSGVLSNGLSQKPAISSDGKFVAYESSAYNLVADDNNTSQDIFVTAIDTQPAEENAPTSLAPVDGSLVKAGKTTQAVSWKPPAGMKAKDIKKYQLQVATNASFTAPLVYDKLAKPAKVALKNLLPNTTYYWRVRAIFKTGSPAEGSWSSTMSFSTAKTAPPKLTAPKNNALQKKATIKLVWKRPTGAPKTTTYTLQYGTDPEFNPGTFTEATLLAKTKYVITDLAAAIPPDLPVTYYWRVMALSADGSTDYSDWSAARAFLR